MKKKNILVGLFLALSTTALAHFQMVYTPNSDVTGKSSVPFEIVFGHPGEGKNEGLMNIGKDEQGNIKPVVDFFVVHNSEKKDLKSYLKESKFGVPNKQVLSYKFTLDKETGLKGVGDWGLVFVPAPYYEKSDDIYIQQITKVFVNREDVPTDWNKRIANGYTEIVPLSSPITWKNQIFRAQVLDNDGNPVPNAEIEVEFINADIKNSKFVGKEKTNHSSAIIYADDKGYFSFIPTEKGYWGFAALNSGKDKEFNGKELEQDAVLWIEAK